MRKFIVTALFVSLQLVNAFGANLGEWTYSKSAAEELADTWDRPLIIKFSNSSGKCSLCNSFEKYINSCDYWKAYASEQQLAMAYIDYDINRDIGCYLNIVSNNPAVTSFPAFAIYASDGTTLLDAFTYGESEPYTAEAFVAKINSILEENDYLIDGIDLWDPTDNNATGATPLKFELYNKRQYHDLNKTPDDTADWYKFQCGRDKLYKLHLPDADYNIDFTSINDSYINSVTNDYHEAVTNRMTAPVVISTTHTFVTNLVSVNQSFDLSLTNGLPKLINVTSDITPPRATTNVVTLPYGPYEYNTPGAPPFIVTNGVPQELVAPSLQIFDAGLTAPLDFVLGGSSVTTNLALLNQLEDGLLFSPAQPCSGDYFFIRIGQQLEGDLPYFETIEYYDRTTNTTITVETNITATAVVTSTTTNITSRWVTYGGPTNIFVGLPTPEYIPAVAIITNTITESFSSIISNYSSEVVSQLSTNQIIYEGSNYVFYSYDRTQYTLNYRLWKPGIISFDKPQLSERESSDMVKVRVTRERGSTGEALFSYTFEDVNTPFSGYTAENGSDFLGVDGELAWADGEDGTKIIEVPLIQDVVPVWEGDETFAVVMTKHDDAAVLQAVMDGDRSVVTLKEATGRHPGVISFSGSSPDDSSDPIPFENPRRPEVFFREGESVTLWLERVDGSDGEISVRVKTKSGTALEDDSFDALDEVVTWLPGDTDPKPVTLDTYELDGFNDEIYFYVELKNEMDAKLGSARKVTLRLRDTLISQTLADTSGAARQHGLSLKSSRGEWFFDDGSALRSEPLAGGDTKLSLTLTGPGVISFDWSINDMEPGDTLTLDRGVVLGKSLAVDGSTISALVPSGRQTLVWTLTAGPPADERDLYALLENMLWQPVPQAFGPTPSDRGQTFETDLGWQMPQTYSVALDGSFEMDNGSGLPLTARVAGVSPAGAVIDNVMDTTLFDLWGEDEPRPGSTYRWQVSTVYAHADGEVVNPAGTWSFKGISSEDSDLTEPPPDGLGGSGYYEAVQGVFSDFGEIYDADDDITCRTAGGSLPSGLKMDPKTGRISGVPSRTGTRSVLIQARSSVDRKTVYYATTQINFRVNSLEDFTGKYIGAMSPGQGDLGFEGAMTLTIDARGHMSAKASVAGNNIAFSQTGADGVDNPEEPGEIYYDEITGPYVTDADGERHYSTLSELYLDADGNGTATLTHYKVSGSGTQDREVTELVYSVMLRKNIWKSDAGRRMAAAFEGYYTVLLPVTSTRDDFAPWGSGYLTVTVKYDGSVKIAGMLADGEKVSFATSLWNISDIDPDESDFTGQVVYIYLFSQPRGYGSNGGVCGFLKLTAGATPEESVITYDPLSPMQWWNYDPQSVYGAGGVEQSTETGFLNELSPAGGFYDRRTNLESFYTDRELTFEDSPDYPGADLLPEDNDGVDGVSGYLLYADILPFGTPLVVEASKLKVPKKQVANYGEDMNGDTLVDGGSAFENIDVDESLNLNNLSISMNHRSGLLKGGFELYYERENQDSSFQQRTEKMKWNGVITRVHPDHDPDEHNLGIQGGGFYLLQDHSYWLNGSGRTRSYEFDWSYPFELQSIETP